MALLSVLLTLLLSLAAFARVLPVAFRLAGRLIGNSIRSKTRHRRAMLLHRAEMEEKEQEQAAQRKRQQKEGGGATASQTASSSTSLDSEWDAVKTPTAQRTPDHPYVDSVEAKDNDYRGVIGFFHPFCNAGGGGERVLFAAILATQQRYPNALCVVYTGDHDASKEQMLSNVHNRFNIRLRPARVFFLYLTTREMVLASKWPYFTLLGQSVGSLWLGWDALTLLAPDIFVDTMGYAFTLWLCKWLFPDVPTAAYVHYPTISTDMLRSLHASDGHGVNSGAGRGAKGKVKQIYWEIFAKLYAWVGGSIDVVMTNSTWTQNHIQALWGPWRSKRSKPHNIGIVYPPCAVAELQQKIPVDAESEKRRTRNLLYIAQFRPEKMHHTIIEAFHSFLKTHHQHTPPASRPRLILVGSVRDDHDEKRVYRLRLQAQEVKDSVDFVVNAPWAQVLEYLKSSSVGVNGMWNEHFGIGVVEYQAAGLISVVNGSGGPQVDIVVPVDGAPTGFHASTTEEFAAGFAHALALSPPDALDMRVRARKNSWRFSEDVFRTAWLDQLKCLVAIQPGADIHGPDQT